MKIRLLAGAAACAVLMCSSLPVSAATAPELPATALQVQGTLAVAIASTSLTAATVEAGGTTLPPCTVPLEIAPSLRFTDATTLTWTGDGSGSAYNLYRGGFSRGAWTFNHACLSSGLVTASAQDSADPNQGQGYYYLVSGRSACGEGSLGTNSQGQPRPNGSPCP